MTATTGVGAGKRVASPRVTLRRRLDRIALRWQARLDADWADRFLPWALAALLFVVLAALSLASIRSLDGGDGLGVWLQSGWRFRHGLGTSSTLVPTDPVFDSWSFVAMPLLLLTRYLPTEFVLATAQAAALAIAVVPLWRLCRDVASLRLGLTCALVLAYSVAPAVQATNLSLFHPEVLAVPALLVAFLASRRGHLIVYVIAVAVILACRADMGLVAAGLGVLLMTEGRKEWGLVTIVVGVAWTATGTLVLDPLLPSGTLTPAEAAIAGGVAPLAALRTVFTDPGVVLGDLFSRQSIDILVTLFGGLLFLPLVAPRYLLPSVPVLVLGLAGAGAVQRAAGGSSTVDAATADQVVVAVAFALVATIFAFSRIGRRNVSRVIVDHRLVAALVIGTLMLFVRDAVSSPFERPWGWGSRDRVDQARIAASEAVGERSVAGSPQVLDLVAQRRMVRALLIEPPGDPNLVGAGVDAVVLDTTGRSVESEWTAEDRRMVLDSLEERGFVRVYTAAGIIALVHDR